MLRGFLRKRILDLRLGLDYLSLWTRLHRVLNGQAHGIGIYDISAAANNDRDETAIRRIEDAVEIAAIVAPAHLHYLGRAGIRLILTESFRAPAAFMPRLRAVVFDRGTILQHRAVFAAALLVHEAVHVRFWRRGFHDIDQHHGRIERCCNAEMLRVIDARAEADYLRDWMRAVVVPGGGAE